MIHACWKRKLQSYVACRSSVRLVISKYAIDEVDVVEAWMCEKDFGNGASEHAKHACKRVAQVKVKKHMPYF